MSQFPSARRESVVQFLKSLRDSIISDFESIEESKSRFVRTPWDYKKGKGGGEMSVIRGETFEKAAVNWSGVEGSKFPGSDADGPFFATGVSLITHMRNPKMPTVHFNIRYLETPEKFWWGGGFDLTPMGFEFEEDTRHFHEVAAKALANFGGAPLYDDYKKRAAEYFYIPHRQKERGVGGIFFDHVNTGDFERDFQMWQSVGSHFTEAVMPIYRKRIHEAYSETDRRLQTERRGHYVEFNLIYDRGTRFGFLSGGNPEAILCSMPPVATW